MAVTLRDLGKMLDLSHSTVSRALRDDPRISEYTRERVRRAAREMGYRVNHSARALVSRKAQSIALIIPDVVDAYFGRIVEGAGQVAHERGYALLLYVTHSDSRREHMAVEEAAMRRYDGIVLFRRHLPVSRLRRAVSAGTPVVLLTRHEPGLNVDSVRVDDVDGGYKAAEHLLGMGHRRIACLTGAFGRQETDARLAGFSQAHRVRGVPVDHTLVWEGDDREVAGVRAAEQIWGMPKESRPTALFACNDRMAIGFLNRARELGLDVPGEISVVGYGDIEACRYTSPSLTTVSQPAYELGSRAAEILIRRLEGECFSPQELLLKIGIVVRGSSAPPPVHKLSEGTHEEGGEGRNPARAWDGVATSAR